MSVSFWTCSIGGAGPHYCDVRLVETDEALKAEHCVEVSREIQLCA